MDAISATSGTETDFPPLATCSLCSSHTDLLAVPPECFHLRASRLALPSARKTFSNYPQNSLTSLGALLMCPLLGQASLTTLFEAGPLPPSTPFYCFSFPDTWCCPSLSHVFVSSFDCLSPHYLGSSVRAGIWFCGAVGAWKGPGVMNERTGPTYHT